MEAPLLWFTNLRIWCNLRTKTTEHDFQSDYLIRIWNIRGYIKGQESRNLNISYSFTQCNNICLLLYMICDIRFNNSTSETRHSDKCESYRWTFVEFYIWQKTREWILVWCAGGWSMHWRTYFQLWQRNICTAKMFANIYFSCSSLCWHTKSIYFMLILLNC